MTRQRGRGGRLNLYVCHSCNKYSYAERSFANQAKRNMRQQGVSGPVLDTYRCPIDPTRWDVGHGAQRQRQIDADA